MVPWRSYNEKSGSMLFQWKLLQRIEKARLPEGWRKTREVLFKLQVI